MRKSKSSDINNNRLVNETDNSSKNGRLCFVMTSFTRKFRANLYDNYIPFFIYSALKAYPDAFCKMFIENKLEKRIKYALDMIRDSGINRFHIYENFINRYSFLANYPHIGGMKSARWILPLSEFVGDDYLFIGDVDFLIIREETTIIDFHLDRAHRLNLPFSNAVRRTTGINEPKRLTGLHFIIKEPYYDLMGDEINKLQSEDYLRKFIEPYKNDFSRNEDFLYALINSKMNLKHLEIEPFQQPMHGIHLGVGQSKRVKKNIDINLLQEKTSLLSSSETVRSLTDDLFNDELFNKLCMHLNEKSIWRWSLALNINMPFRRTKYL